eukprot:366104-Chlamydomonas_euryale.AAC.11
MAAASSPSSSPAPPRFPNLRPRARAPRVWGAGGVNLWQRRRRGTSGHRVAVVAGTPVHAVWTSTAETLRPPAQIAAAPLASAFGL